MDERRDDRLVTVIIPVYNSVKYLDKCIQSIQKQEYQDMEIIIVDDGSTDGTSELCDRFQSEDARITVIHKQNNGVSSARKEGLKRAKGKFTLFVDSDDWIEPDMVAALYGLAVRYQAEIVTSGCYKENAGGERIKIVDGIKEGVYGRREEKEYLYKNMIYPDGNTESHGIIGYLVNKLVKTDLLKELHEEISETIRLSEDRTIVYGCCVRAEKIVVTHNAYYHYEKRLGTASGKRDLSYFDGIYKIYDFLNQEFGKSSYKNILLKQLDRFMMMLALEGLSYLWADWENAVPFYDFERNALPKDARVVLYSAGRVGQAYYKHIYADKIYRLAGWVDKNYLYYRKQGMDVSPVESIKQTQFDYVLLAFKYEEMALAVKEQLMNEYRIEAYKILWLPPVTVADKFWIKPIS